MSFTSLTQKIGACVMAFGMAACSSIGGRAYGPKQAVADVPQMGQTAVVRDPCNSVGIEAVPATQVTQIEMNQNIRQGLKVSFHRGYYLFSEVSLAEKFAPIGGFVVGAVLGSGIGAGTGKLIAGTLGAVGGAAVGEQAGKNARVESLVDLAACRNYLNQLGEAAPLRNRFQSFGLPSDRPINARPRGFDGEERYYQQGSPYYEPARR